MKKSLYLSIILLISLFTFTGCYDAISVENYAYVIAIGFDKNSSDKITLSVQIANSSPSESGNSNQSTKTNIISVDCLNISEGISIINNYSTKKINLSHCTVIAFSEELAQSGIQPYISYLINKN